MLVQTAEERGTLLGGRLPCLPGQEILNLTDTWEMDESTCLTYIFCFMAVCWAKLSPSGERHFIRKERPSVSGPS